MDESSGRNSERGAAWRRRQRRLRSWWRHEQQSVAAALATFSHHSAQRPKMARAEGGGGAGARVELHGRAPDDAPSPPPSPQEAGAEYFAVPQLGVEVVQPFKVSVGLATVSRTGWRRR